MPSTTDWITSAASAVAALGVIGAFLQLRLAKQIAQLQFEDNLSKEYRELAGRLPTEALLGEVLSEYDYRQCFDELFHYFDLCNEQVLLRKRNRITIQVWAEWASGIQANLALPAFARSWADVKAHSDSFAELRTLESKSFSADPAKWE